MDHPYARRLILVLELLLGVAAVVGGALLVADPSGRLLQLSTSLLSGFSSFLVPGLLLTAVGLVELACAYVTWRRSPSSMLVAQGAGGLIVLWICFQTVLMRPVNPLELIVLAVGGLIFIVAHEVHRDESQTP